MSDNENEISIGDMYFASALLAYGANLLRVDKTDQKRQKFWFENTPLDFIVLDESGEVSKVTNATIEFAENRFLARKLWFPPNYSDSIRRIKTAIYS